MNAEQRARYPADWKWISRRIRFQRAGGRCECRGLCGRYHGAKPGSRARCKAVHGAAHPVTGSRVELQTAHLDHDPSNSVDANLLALCQRCHVNLDAAPKAAALARKRHQARAIGDLPGLHPPTKGRSKSPSGHP